jgi:hypothetical protein
VLALGGGARDACRAGQRWPETVITRLRTVRAPFDRYRADPEGATRTRAENFGALSSHAGLHLVAAWSVMRIRRNETWANRFLEAANGPG